MRDGGPQAVPRGTVPYVLKVPPIGWQRVLDAATRRQGALSKELRDALATLQGKVSVDEIVRALEGSTTAMGAVLAAVSLNPQVFDTLTDMATAAGRTSWRMVLEEGRRRGTIGPFAVDFARIDYVAGRWAAEHSAELVTFINEETRAELRALFARAPVEGVTVDQQARLIRQVVGLNERQGMAVVNRYNAMTGQWQRGELSWQQIERNTSRYVAELTRERALMIARTESRNAAIASTRASWQEAIDNGFIDPGEALQEWTLGPDPCDDCVQIAEDESPWRMDETPPDGPHPNCMCGLSLVYPEQLESESRMQDWGESVELARAVISKPLGQYPDFAACVAAMSSKIGVEAARRYCGRLQSLIEG